MLRSATTATIPNLVSMRLNSFASSRECLLPRNFTSLRHQRFLRSTYMRSGGQGPNLLHGRNLFQSRQRRAADSTMALIGRIAVVVTFAALVALLTIFAKPLWQGLNADSQTLQASKSSDRPTANNAPLEPVAPNTQVAAAPAVVPATVAQPAPASPAPAAVPVAQPPANAQQQAVARTGRATRTRQRQDSRSRCNRH